MENISASIPSKAESQAREAFQAELSVFLADQCKLGDNEVDLVSGKLLAQHDKAVERSNLDDLDELVKNVCS